MKKWLPDVAMIVGGLSISYGAGLTYEPAGFIVFGLLTLAAGVILARAG